MQIDITVSVNGDVNQTIELNPDCTLTQGQVITGLKEGRIITSIGYGVNNGRVYQFGTAPVGLIEIGRVVSQESCDDLEITISEF